VTDFLLSWPPCIFREKYPAGLGSHFHYRIYRPLLAVNTDDQGCRE